MRLISAMWVVAGLLSSASVLGAQQVPQDRPTQVVNGVLVDCVDWRLQVPGWCRLYRIRTPSGVEATVAASVIQPAGPGSPIMIPPQYLGMRPDTVRVPITDRITAGQQTLPDRFDTSGACLDALTSGQFRFYQPSFFRPVALSDGERTVPLEHDACVRMEIVGRIAWVPQAAGTKVDYRGALPVRRQDCGNRIYEIVYPDTPAEIPPITLPPLIQRDTVYLDRWHESPPVVVPPPTLVKKDDGWWPFGTKTTVGLVGAAACGGYMLITGEKYCLRLRFWQHQGQGQGGSR